MKTQNKLTLLAGCLFIAGAITFVSCKKKTTTPTSYNASGTADNSTGDNTSKDLNNIGSEAIDNGYLTTYKLTAGNGSGGLLTPMSGTVTVMIDSIASKWLTVTFNNYIGMDGRSRSGTLKYDWSGSTNGAVYFKDNGFDVKVSSPSNDYYVDNNHIVINQKEVKNIGPDATTGYYTWTDVANINIIKANNGGTITWNRTGTMVLVNTNAVTYNGASVAGVYPTSSGFIDWAKSIIGFTGSVTGTTASGNAYTATITTRVDYNMNCSPISAWQYFHPPVAGAWDYTQGGTTYHIDYGNQTCDNTYVVSVGTWSTTLSFI